MIDYEQYIIVDLEATCDDRISNTFNRDEMEIIEIGAVRLDRNLNVVDEFQTFISPIRTTELTEFCKTLTTITQDEVDSAPSFKEAMENFYNWIGDTSNTIWMSWGQYDKNQFDKDHEYHELENKLPTHRNAKVLFSQAIGVKKGFGMVRALKRAGIELDGTHHRGIDDARNIAKLIPYCLGRKIIK
jgi:inhibitor of KinA sporulation pathway (predicted exonuclease)